MYVCNTGSDLGESGGRGGAGGGGGGCSGEQPNVMSLLKGSTNDLKLGPLNSRKYAKYPADARPFPGNLPIISNYDYGGLIIR